MRIFRRIRTAISSDIHELLARNEGPLGMLNQYTRDLDCELKKAQHILANQLYLENKFAMLIEEAEGLVAKRTRQLELATSRNEEDMARLALHEKAMCEKKLEMYQNQYEATKIHTAKLSEQIEQLREKQQELQYQKLVLSTRAHATQTVCTEEIDFNINEVMKGFANAEEYVLRLEAEAQARELFRKPIKAKKVQATTVAKPALEDPFVIE